MSNSVNQINQRILNLHALVGQGANIERVLTNGNDAGGLDISGVDNLVVTTINGATYPPIVSSPTLSSVLTGAGANTATNDISLNNIGNGNNVIYLLPNASIDNPTITLTDGVGSATINTINKYGYTTRRSVQNLTHYLTFTGASTTGTGIISKTNGIQCNPSSATITATTFAGTATSASAITITNDTATNATFYPTFVNGAGTGISVRSDTTGLTFNPSTNTLTCADFSGNATSATYTPSNVNNAVNVVYTANVNNFVKNNNVNYKMDFVSDTSGNRGLNIDNDTFTFNPSTNTLTTTTFAGKATTSSRVITTLDNTSNFNYLIPFKTEGDSAVFVNTKLNFNPSTNTLTAATFDGNASTATSTPNNVDNATNATYAGFTDNVNTLTTGTNAGTNYLTFVTDTGGYLPCWVDSNLLGYNPTTNILTTEKLKLINTPTSNSGLATGFVYRTGNILKVNLAPVFQRISADGQSKLINNGTQRSAGAYGLVKLNSSYTGPTIQIKAGTSGTPTNFYAQSTTEYGTLNSAANGTGQSLSAFLGGATAYITTWYDQTGNSYHATGVAASATAPTGNLPTYNLSYNNVDFGVVSGSTTGGYFTLPNSAFPTGNSPYTYMVTQLNAGTTTKQSIVSGGSYNTGLMYSMMINFSAANTYFSVWYQYNAAYTAVGGLNGEKMCETYNGTSADRKLYRNNSLVSWNLAPSGTRNQTIFNNVLGNQVPGQSDSGKYIGSLKYLVWCPSVLTLADTTIIQNALSI